MACRVQAPAAQQLAHAARELGNPDVSSRRHQFAQRERRLAEHQAQPRRRRTGQYPSTLWNVNNAARNLLEIIGDAARTDNGGDYPIRIFTIGMGNLAPLLLGTIPETPASILRGLRMTGYRPTSTRRSSRGTTTTRRPQATSDRRRTRHPEPDSAVEQVGEGVTPKTGDSRNVVPEPPFLFSEASHENTKNTKLQITGISNPESRIPNHDASVSSPRAPSAARPRAGR